MKSSVRNSSTRRKVPLLSSIREPRVKLRKELLPRGDLRKKLFVISETRNQIDELFTDSPGD